MIEESFLKSNFIGRDGFRWWIGQIPPVEAWDGQANNGGWGNRYKVRILGYHPYSKADLSDDDLPWAGVIIPPTAGTGAANYAQSVRIKPGDIVIGFFLDGDNGQLPMIMGSFGRTNQVPQDAPSGAFIPFTGYTSRVPPPPAKTLSKSEANEQEEDAQKTPRTLDGKKINQINSSKDKDKEREISISSTFGLTEIAADACGDSFVGNVSGALDNLIAKVDSGINLMEDIASVTTKIQALSNGMVATMTEKLYSSMIPTMQGGLERLYDATYLMVFATTQNSAAAKLAGIAAQKSMVSPIKKIQDKLDCLPGKIVNGLGGTIRGMLDQALLEVVNTGTCITEQFAGSLLNGITDQISSELDGVMGGVEKILPSAYKIKDMLGSASDMIQTADGFFGCNQSDSKCVGKINKSILGQGPDKPFDLESTYSNVLKNMNVFGSSGDTVASPFQKPNCAEPSSCGAPKVEIFGGDGIGGAARAILGGFVDNTAGLSDLTASITRTASIIGVEITDPGALYFSAPPMIAFVDPCKLGYGAIGRAIVDFDPSSPTYGEIIGVNMISEGENYPVSNNSIDEDEAINSNEIPIGVTKTHIINTGSGYGKDTVVTDGNTEYSLNISDGKIISATPINSIEIINIPKITIVSSTGSGALIKPIVGKLPLTPQGEIIQIIDCVS
jgi:hypothetical protein